MRLLWRILAGYVIVGGALFGLFALPMAIFLIALGLGIITVDAPSPLDQSPLLALLAKVFFLAWFPIGAIAGGFVGWRLARLVRDFFTVPRKAKADPEDWSA